MLQKLDLYLIEIFYVNHYKMTEVCNEITQTTIDLINIYREKKELLTKAKEKLK